MVITELYNEHCLTTMSRMSNKQVDLTITSPPYNMNLRIRKGKHCSRQIVKELSTKYPDFSDNLPMDDYYNFHRDVINELLRVSKITFYNIQFLTGNKSALYKLIGEFNENIKEFIIWDKVNAQPAIGNNVLNSQFEVLLVLCDKDYAISRAFNDDNCEFGRGTLSNVWQIKSEKKRNATMGAAMPCELVEKIIDNFNTKFNATVYDPFAGTGTTLAIAQSLGYNSIGSEISELQYNHAKQRLGL